MKQYLYNLATDRQKGPIAVIFKAFLFLLSLFYGILLSICRRINSSKPFRPPCKVISIGNITWGGTGKTSLVKWILELLGESGRSPAVLIRGYGRKNKDESILVKGAAEGLRVEKIGDEAYMLSEDFPDVPILIDSDRRRSSKKACKEPGIDTAILDDGFQQWKLHRDLDIVLVNANDPFGNGYLIPRGILREPVSSLKRADIILLTKVDSEGQGGLLKRIKKINPDALVAYAGYMPQYFYGLSDKDNRVELCLMRDKSVCVFSGIGDPESFEDTIAECGARIDLRLRFPDHHCYSEKDIIKIKEQCRQRHIDVAITSRKDAVRINDYQAFGGLGVLILKAELMLKENKDAFLQRVLSLYTA